MAGLTIHPGLVRRSWDQLIANGVTRGDWRYPEPSGEALAAWPYLVAYTRDGDLGVEVGSTRTRLREGELLLARNDPRLRMTRLDDRAAALLCLPRATVQPFLDSFDARVGTVWETARGGSAGLVGHVLDAILDDLEGFAPRSPGRFVQHLVGLLEVMCSEERPAATSRLVADAKHLIESQLASPRLTPDSTAARLYVSTRTLHRLFGAEGSTVAAWIRRRRLEQCRIDLDDPACDSIAASAIGARWGLADASHFCRLFKAEYGCTPARYRELRRELEADSRSSHPIDLTA